MLLVLRYQLYGLIIFLLLFLQYVYAILLMSLDDTAIYAEMFRNHKNIANMDFNRISIQRIHHFHFLNILNNEVLQSLELVSQVDQGLHYNKGLILLSSVPNLIDLLVGKEHVSYPKCLPV